MFIRSDFSARAANRMYVIIDYIAILIRACCYFGLGRVCCGNIVANCLKTYAKAAPFPQNGGGSHNVFARQSIVFHEGNNGYNFKFSVIIIIIYGDCVKYTINSDIALPEKNIFRIATLRWLVCVRCSLCIYLAPPTHEYFLGLLLAEAPFLWYRIGQRHLLA